MKRCSKHFITALAILACTCFCVSRSYAAAGPGGPAAKIYTFGVVPQFEQRKLYGTWKPIIDELEKRTGLTFDLVTTFGIRQFEQAYLKGNFDFVYMNPYHIAKTKDTVGYVPLVADKTPLRGILVVRKDSPLRTVRELDGAVIAFPSPNAIGASLIMRADLDRLFHVTVKPLYVKSHSSVYLHVVTGLAAAGGGVEKTLAEQKQEVRDALRIIYTTKGFPSHPVAAHPRVPKSIREKVRQAFLAMGREPEGKALLSAVPIHEIVPVAMSDYTVLLDWGVDDYWDSSWKED